MSRAARIARHYLILLKNANNNNTKTHLLRELWNELVKEDPTFYLDRGMFGRSAEVSELYAIAQEIVDAEVLADESSSVYRQGFIWKKLMPTVINNGVLNHKGKGPVDLPADERELILVVDDSASESYNDYDSVVSKPVAEDRQLDGDEGEGEGDWEKGSQVSNDDQVYYNLYTVGEIQRSPGLFRSLSADEQAQFFKKESWSAYFNRNEENFKREAYKFIALSILTVGAYPVFYVMNKSLTAVAFSFGKLVKACLGWTYADIAHYKKYPLGSSNKTWDKILVTISPAVAWAGYLFVGWVLSPILITLHNTLYILLNPVETAKLLNTAANAYGKGVMDNKNNVIIRPNKYKWFFCRLASILVIPAVLTAYAALIMFAAPAVAGLFGAVFGISNAAIATTLAKMSSIFPQFYMQAGQFFASNMIGSALANLGVLAYSGIVEGMAMICTMLVTAKLGKMFWRAVEYIWQKGGPKEPLAGLRFSITHTPDRLVGSVSSIRQEDQRPVLDNAGTFAKLLADGTIFKYSPIGLYTPEAYAKWQEEAYFGNLSEGKTQFYRDALAYAQGVPREHGVQQAYNSGSTVPEAVPATASAEQGPMDGKFNYVVKNYPYNVQEHGAPANYAQTMSYMYETLTPSDRTNLQQRLVAYARQIYDRHCEEQRQQQLRDVRRGSGEFSFAAQRGGSPTFHAPVANNNNGLPRDEDDTQTSVLRTSLSSSTPES